MYFFFKTIISAIIIVAVSEIAKKYTWTAAIIVSLPLTSLLAFIWLYWDTKDTIMICHAIDIIKRVSKLINDISKNNEIINKNIPALNA